MEQISCWNLSEFIKTIIWWDCYKVVIWGVNNHKSSDKYTSVLQRGLVGLFLVDQFNQHWRVIQVQFQQPSKIVHNYNIFLLGIITSQVNIDLSLSLSLYIYIYVCILTHIYTKKNFLVKYINLGSHKPLIRKLQI